jgi:hypothetical protein
MFREYVQRIVDLAEGDAEYPDENAKKKDLLINQSRIDAWKKTISYQNFREVCYIFVSSSPLLLQLLTKAGCDFFRTKWR